jgi:hypothetical protein
MPIKPTDKPKRLTRDIWEYDYGVNPPARKRLIKTIEFYAPLMVRCPNGEKHKAYIRDNIYGTETYLGTIKLKLDGKKKEVEIPGWVKPNKHKPTHYIFIPYQDSPYAYVFLKTLEELPL